MPVNSKTLVIILVTLITTLSGGCNPKVPEDISPVPPTPTISGECHQPHLFLM